MVNFMVTYIMLYILLKLKFQSEISKLLGMKFKFKIINNEKNIMLRFFIVVFWGKSLINWYMHYLELQL